MTNVPSGWYENPHNRAEELYWDGATWSGASRRRASPRANVAAGHDTLREDVTMILPGMAQHQLRDESAWAEENGRAASSAVSPAVSPKNGFAIAALALGISGAFLAVLTPLLDVLFAGMLGSTLFSIAVFVVLIPDVLAIVFGILAVIQARKLDGKGVITALVGATLGALSILFALL